MWCGDAQENKVKEMEEVVCLAQISVIRHREPGVPALSGGAKRTQKPCIHQNSNGRAGALAQNILQTADTLTYKESYILPTSGAKTGKIRRHRAARTFENDKLKVYPNPARDYVIVEYQLAGDADKAVVKVIDNNGFIRKTILQENNQGFLVIDTRGLETGTYIAHIATNGKLLGVAKFVIIN